MDVWDLIGYQGDPPSTVEIAVDGGIPSALSALLAKLKRCGLDTGYVLLALLAEKTLDPLGVWETLWQTPEAFPLLRLRDGKPQLLFIRNLGFFPFGEALPNLDTGKTYDAAEGILVVDLRNSSMGFLRQTSTMSPAQAPPTMQQIAEAAQLHFNGKYYPAWSVDDVVLRQQIEPLREAVERAQSAHWDSREFLQQFVRQQILGGMQHTISQWELEKNELRESEVVEDAPPEITAARLALVRAQEETPLDVVVPEEGLHKRH